MIKSGLSSKSASDVPSAVLTCSLHTQFTRRVNPAAPVHRSKLVLASARQQERARFPEESAVQAKRKAAGNTTTSTKKSDRGMEKPREAS
jgi:hypothetical protein